LFANKYEMLVRKSQGSKLELMSAVRKPKSKPKSKPKRRATQLERTEAARAKIIEGAFKCIGSRGYNQTTLTDIATVAGCSRELPRYHFGSKENLLKALLDDTHDEWIRQLKAAMERGIKGVDAVALIADGFARIYREDSSVMRGRLTLTLGAADPGNSQLRAQVHAMQEEVVELFGQLIASGLKPKSDYKPKALSSILFGALRGIAYQWMTEPDSVDVTELFDELKKLLRHAFA
jgi:AcrR family transcriptional regulator